MHRLVIFLFLISVVCYSGESYALIKCQLGDMDCLYKANKERDAEYKKKTGEDFVAPLYGETGPKHLEYDIVHKDGTKEHCYQTMEGHSIICR